jgi:hypothetical protein
VAAAARAVSILVESYAPELELQNS